MANTIKIYFKDQPDLKEVFSRKVPGEVFGGEFKAVLTQANEEMAEATIQELTLDPGDDGEEKSVTPSPDEPVVISIVMANKRERTAE